MAISKITRSGIKDGDVDVSNDTTPQLGGNLDTNSQNIVIDDAHGILDENNKEQIVFQTTASAVNQIDITNAAASNAPQISATGDDTNIDLKLTPKGSGKLNLDGIKFPNADGTADQILTTNGSGVLSFVDNSGGTSWVSAVKTANFTAVAGEGYFVNTSGGAFEIDLPGSPAAGDEIEFVDFARTFATNNLTLDQGSNKFQSQVASAKKAVFSTSGQSIKIVYSGSTQGWIPKTDDDVDYLTNPVYTADYLVIAGGGGGGFDQGGGGGAGGYRASFNSEASGGGGSSETALTLTSGTQYTVTVGAAGAAGTSSGSAGGTGGDSSISGSGITTVTSAGGGGGGTPAHSSGDATNGGSGGGSSGGGGALGQGTANQGFNGGNRTSDGGSTDTGGGGGAGEAGSTDQRCGGGDGVASTITGSSVTRAGGGGGMDYNNNHGGAPGGDGGGGGGSTTAPRNAPTAGTTNTGGGGGGGSGNASSNGAAGGSGVVILRVATSNYSSTVTGSPTVTTSGSDTIIAFTGSGSYTA